MGCSSIYSSPYLRAIERVSSRRKEDDAVLVVRLLESFGSEAGAFLELREGEEEFVLVVVKEGKSGKGVGSLL